MSEDQLPLALGINSADGAEAYQAWSEATDRILEEYFPDHVPTPDDPGPDEVVVKVSKHGTVVVTLNYKYSRYVPYLGTNDTDIALRRKLLGLGFDFQRTMLERSGK